MSISVLIVAAFAVTGVLAGSVKALLYILPNKEGRMWLAQGEYIMRRYIMVHAFYGAVIGIAIGIVAAYIRSRLASP